MNEFDAVLELWKSSSRYSWYKPLGKLLWLSSPDSQGRSYPVWQIEGENPDRWPVEQ